MFKGIFTALITPFKNGELDISSFERMVNWQIESGIHGLVIAGSTGEGQSLSKEEFIKIIKISVKLAKGKISIIANTGLNSTSDSIKLTKAVQELEIDGVMLVAPYYIKPTQEGLYQHFKTIHDATDIPIMLYNHPGRTGVDINNSTIVRLSKLQRIVSLKDATADVLRCSKIKQEVNEDFSVFSGDDALALPYFSQGATGLISVSSNIVPSLLVKLYHLWNNNRIKDALELQSILLSLNESLSCESNPIPIKYAASIFQLCSSEMRLPLTQLSNENKVLIQQSIDALKAKLL